MAQNEDVVRRVYESWGAGDIPGPVELLDPDIEYVNPVGAIEPGTRSGVAAFTAALETVFEAYEYWRTEVESLEPIGDHVVAVVAYTLKGRGSGLEIRGRESALWTLRDGKVLRYEWFHGVDDARSAAEAGR